jgi:hypothetical protein
MAPIFGWMESFFAPLFVIVIVCLLLESIALVFGDFAMTNGCRIIITLLLVLAYMLKQEMTQRALRRKSRNLVRSFHYLILIVCLITVIFHSLFLLYFPASRLYSSILCLLSLLVSADEYADLAWLQERQHTHRMRYKAGQPLTLPITLSEVEVQKELPQKEEEKEDASRITLYYTIYSSLVQFIVKQQQQQVRNEIV